MIISDGLSKLPTTGVKMIADYMLIHCPLHNRPNYYPVPANTVQHCTLFLMSVSCCSKVLPRVSKIFWQSRDGQINRGEVDYAPWAGWDAFLCMFCCFFIAKTRGCLYSSIATIHPLLWLIMNPSWTQQPFSVRERAPNTWEPHLIPTGGIGELDIQKEGLQWSIPLATGPLCWLHIQTFCGQLDQPLALIFRSHGCHFVTSCLNITCLRFFCCCYLRLPLVYRIPHHTPPCSTECK